MQPHVLIAAPFRDEIKHFHSRCHRIFDLVENCPELQNNEQVNTLTEKLEGYLDLLMDSRSCADMAKFFKYHAANERQDALVGRWRPPGLYGVDEELLDAADLIVSCEDRILAPFDPRPPQSRLCVLRQILLLRPPPVRLPILTIILRFGLPGKRFLLWIRLSFQEAVARALHMNTRRVRCSEGRICRMSMSTVASRMGFSCKTKNVEPQSAWHM